MYRKLHLDFEALGRMHARALSDLAIGRVLGCSRQTVLNYRRRLGLASRWGRRRSNLRARQVELDRLWARLSVEEKTTLLLGQVIDLGSLPPLSEAIPKSPRSDRSEGVSQEAQ